MPTTTHDRNAVGYGSCSEISRDPKSDKRKTMNIDGSQGSPALPGSSGSNQQEGVDKEAFLQLLVAQLEHQDPLSPMEGTDFVDQMATFTQVEQQISQSKSLDLISLQLTGLASNEAVSLIGKDVTIRGNTIAYDGENATGAAATLDRSASEVTVTIRDANGQAVRTMDLGPTPGGAVQVPWDGRDDAGNPVPAGSFTMEIAARDSDGGVVDVSQDVKGRVVGVTFDKGYPEIILDSGARAPISDLIDVAEPGHGPSGTTSHSPDHVGQHFSGATPDPSDLLTTTPTE